ncbi:MAG: ATP-dependent DNA helicase [Candidatus Gracilibacteria bacterium]|jgi:DNA helicase-2/ATP-dependent DNA helicase PcrA|nr:ATP-dependent DNA helicase [Candidatus Gracilibacteria bacterium]
MSFEERYKRLNDSQRSAVDTIDGPVLVIAGPGSGKTELLSVRTANILKNTDTLASNILCITYTEAAAENMRERLKKLIGKDAYKVFISTFHSLGSFIINHYPEYFYSGAHMSPMDDITRVEIINKILDGLELKSQLKSSHPSEGYTYYSDIKDKISELKDSGIFPNEYKEILEKNKSFLEMANPVFESLFANRINKETITNFEKVLIEIKNIPNEKTLRNFPTMKETLIDTMNEVLQRIPFEKTKPITAFKEEFFAKDDDKNLKFKDLLNIKKNFELCDVYESYEKIREERALYDYSDMILETISVIEKNPTLHYELAERFQYIMVDEFQDTNGAQMKLLDCLIDEEVTEGRPNILAVGDDDQSIFKFQGAKVQNILNFHKKYRDTQMIVLSKNYRSEQQILDKIRDLIIQGETRLENMEGIQIDKTLSSFKETKSGDFSFSAYPSKEYEFEEIAKKINELIEKSVPLGEIAVLMRKHKDLEELAKFLDMKNIKLSYEKQKNILEEIHIKEILNILKFVNSLANKSMFEADELLPEILSSSFLNLPSLEIWRLSLAVSYGQYWLEKMTEHENIEIQNFAKYLIELAKISKIESAETMIDFVLGNKEIQLDENTYTSPYKNFYFSDKEWNENRRTYLERLKSIQRLVSKVRSYKPEQNLSLKDLVKFIETHENYSLPIYVTDKFIDESAVNLITVHSSKGLEFDTVFMAGLSENAWSKNRSSKIKLPKNLPVSKDMEDSDDTLRLLYVGMSRAKRNLFLSFHKNPLAKKQGEELSHLCVFKMDDSRLAEETPQDLSLLVNKLNSYTILNEDENAFLKDITKNYRLSVTHLKNFLDLVHGGPEVFLKRNLLRFPEKKSPYSEFGSACHEALELTHKNGKLYGQMPEKHFLIETFEKRISTKRILRTDYEKYLEAGREYLSQFYDTVFKNINLSDFTEFDFGKEDISIDGIKIKGKLDRIHLIDDSSLEVVDYKTGRAFSTWYQMRNKSGDKLWHFEMQLYFYKILVESSRKFGGKFKVDSGRFEFIEPDKATGKTFTLSLNYEAQKEERLRRLIKAVSKHISELKFPNVEHYPKTIQGIRAFEDDLLANEN